MVNLKLKNVLLEISYTQKRALQTIKSYDEEPYEVQQTSQVIPASPETKTPARSVPAVIWSKKGNPHKETGPAIIPAWADETKLSHEEGEYYLFGKQYPNFQSWARAVDKLKRIRSDYELPPSEKPPMMPSNFRVEEPELEQSQTQPQVQQQPSGKNPQSGVQTKKIVSPQQQGSQRKDQLRLTRMLQPNPFVQKQQMDKVNKAMKFTKTPLVNPFEEK